jgi:hypothetical protein
LRVHSTVSCTKIAAGSSPSIEIRLCLGAHEGHRGYPELQVP